MPNTHADRAVPVLPGSDKRKTKHSARGDAAFQNSLIPRYVPWVLLTPAGLIFAALTLIPIGYLLLISFTDYAQAALFTGMFNFVGIDQYTGALTDPEFYRSTLRTVLFTFAMVAGSMGVGLAVANLMTRLGRVMRYAVTVVLIFAWGIPTVTSTLLWSWLFQPSFGIANWFLTKLRIFGDMSQTAWASQPFLALAAIWLLVVWHSVPFIALTIYAAQSQVPKEYLDAARIDGANAWTIYRNIVIPYIRPTLLLVTILSVIWDFNIFNDIWLFSKGGPDNATSTLGIWTFTTAFVGFQLGRGAAIAVITTIMISAVTWYYIRQLLRSGEQL